MKEIFFELRSGAIVLVSVRRRGKLSQSVARNMQKCSIGIV